ncbi:MAG: carboxypeptidase regulatory-like domain-containing protein, partial [Blastocatellia bacterium]
MRYNLRHLLLIFSAVALVALTALTVAAQNPTGSIRGTVADEQGAVIPKAEVTVTNKGTGDVRKATTSDDGTYSVENLQPGQYDIKAGAANFAAVIKTVTVSVGNATTGDIALRAGGKNEVVDVVSSDTSSIDKTDYKIDGVINRQTIDDLPLNGRNFLQLALLEPGVSVSAKNPGSQNNLFNVSVGGANSALTRLTVDGGSIVDPVCGGAAQNFSTETIQEFQISTFNFDLSTGVTSVGAVNIVSRTGTNQYHGNGFLYFRDHSIAAVPTLIQDPSGVSPFFRRYQYGGAIGGPIKKDRVWFFANFERLDQNAAIGAAVNGFAGSSQFDTVTTSPYKGILANGRMDFKLTDKHTAFVRYSHDNNNVFGPDTNNSLASNWRQNSSNDDNLQAGLTSILTNNVVNDVRFNFQRIINNEDVPTATQCPPTNISCLGLGGPEIRILNSNFQAGNSVNAFQARDLHRYQTADNLSWQKGAHRLKFGGEWEHNYGTGHWAFANPSVVVLFNPGQALGVDALTQNLPLPAALKAALNIPVPASFVTGGPISLNDFLSLPIVTAVAGIGDPSQPPPFQTGIARQSNRYRLYAQDQWLVKPGFTLSYGLSYTNETNLENYDLPKPALLQPIVGKTGKPSKDYTDFAPSAGFAWDVGNKGKTVIRGGAGLYYDTVLFVTRLQERATIGPAGNGRSQVAGAYFRNNIAFPQLNLPGPLAPFNAINPPLGAGIDFEQIPTKFTGQNYLDVLNAQTPIILNLLQQSGAAGFTGIDFFKTGTGLLDPNLQVPYSLQYSLGVQRQLPHNMALSADFVLRKQVHQLVQTDEEFFKRVPSQGGPVIPPCVGAAAANPAAQCANGPIDVVQSTGRSTYKALLVRLDKRFSNRYEFTASYALSSL